MTEEELPGLERAAELAREFDHSFAEPLRVAVRDVENLLALRAGKDDCLVRLSETRGLVEKPTIVHLPSRSAELLGIAGVRGSLVPVYSLAALVGQVAPTDPPPWLLLVESDGLIGFAFEELAGYVRLDRHEIATLPPDDPRRAGASVAEAARVGEALRGIIGIPSLVAALKQRAGEIGARKEE
ncbi:MAG TPA: chemotaxis protein CheW [Polyangia bacterium]|jgi:chemotaxis signal transduction protein